MRTHLDIDEDNVMPLVSIEEDKLTARLVLDSRGGRGENTFR
jgi:hypothetical protein